MKPASFYTTMLQEIVTLQVLLVFADKCFLDWSERLKTPGNQRFYKIILKKGEFLETRKSQTMTSKKIEFYFQFGVELLSTDLHLLFCQLLRNRLWFERRPLK